MRKLFTGFAALAIVIVSSQPAMARKKISQAVINAHLRTLNKIYVEGSSSAVSYIRENLSRRTCLSYTPEKSEADAVLQIYEESPVPCGGEPRPGMNGPEGGGCSQIEAKLFDGKTKKLLWYREDSQLPEVGVFQHRTDEPYQWVLWNLNNSCCKGRRTTGSSPQSN